MRITNRKSVLYLLALAFFSAMNLFSFSMFFNLWHGQRKTPGEWSSSVGLSRETQDQIITETSSIPRVVSFKPNLTTSGSRHWSKKDSEMEHLFDYFHKFLFVRDTKTRETTAIKAPRLDRIWNVWEVNYTMDKAHICYRNSSGANLSAIVMIISAPPNVAQRDSIRETWGRKLSHGDTRLLFFVGRSVDPNVENSLLLEDAIRGDVVQANFTDSYTNLTLKSVLLLRWVKTHCPSARSVLKVDDDVFVNAVQFRNMLETNALVGKRVLGHVAYRWKPIRDRRSHYYVSESAWTSSIYPKFVTGPAYVVTRDAVVAILAQVSSVPFFYLEDVYVTGMCAERAGVQKLNHRGFFNKKLPINPCLYHKLVTVHHLGGEEMRGARDVLESRLANDSSCYETKCVTEWLGICLATGRVPVNYLKNSLKKSTIK